MKKLIFPEIDLTNVKGVLIDLDNTLYFFNDANQYALQKVYALLKQKTKMSFSAFYEAYQTAWDKLFNTLGEVPSAHTRFTMFQQFLEKRKVPKAFLIAQKLEEVYFKNLFKKARPDPKATAFLKECARRQIPVCIVTNLFGSIQTRKLKRLRLDKYVDYMVANDELGIDKPHPSLFERGLEKLSIPAKDAIMVGDNEEKDINGAKALGIQTYLVTIQK